jgi:hypothetical protein
MACVGLVTGKDFPRFLRASFGALSWRSRRCPQDQEGTAVPLHALLHSPRPPLPHSSSGPQRHWTERDKDSHCSSLSHPPNPPNPTPAATSVSLHAAMPSTDPYDGIHSLLSRPLVFRFARQVLIISPTGPDKLGLLGPKAPAV